MLTHNSNGSQAAHSSEDVRREVHQHILNSIFIQLEESVVLLFHKDPPFEESKKEEVQLAFLDKLAQFFKSRIIFFRAEDNSETFAFPFEELHPRVALLLVTIMDFLVPNLSEEPSGLQGLSVKENATQVRPRRTVSRQLQQRILSVIALIVQNLTVRNNVSLLRACVPGISSFVSRCLTVGRTSIKGHESTGESFMNGMLSSYGANGSRMQSQSLFSRTDMEDAIESAVECILGTSIQQLHTDKQRRLRTAKAPRGAHHGCYAREGILRLLLYEDETLNYPALLADSGKPVAVSREYSHFRTLRTILVLILNIWVRALNECTRIDDDWLSSVISHLGSHAMIVLSEEIVFVAAHTRLEMLEDCDPVALMLPLVLKILAAAKDKGSKELLERMSRLFILLFYEQAQVSVYASGRNELPPLPHGSEPVLQNIGNYCRETLMTDFIVQGILAGALLPLFPVYFAPCVYFLTKYPPFPQINSEVVAALLQRVAAAVSDAVVDPETYVKRTSPESTTEEGALVIAQDFSGNTVSVKTSCNSSKTGFGNRGVASEVQTALLNVFVNTFCFTRIVDGLLIADFPDVQKTLEGMLAAHSRYKVHPGVLLLRAYLSPVCNGINFGRLVRELERRKEQGRWPLKDVKCSFFVDYFRSTLPLCRLLNSPLNAGEELARVLFPIDQWQRFDENWSLCSARQQRFRRAVLANAIITGIFSIGVFFPLLAEIFVARKHAGEKGYAFALRAARRVMVLLIFPLTEKAALENCHDVTAAATLALSLLGHVSQLACTPLDVTVVSSSLIPAVMENAAAGASFVLTQQELILGEGERLAASTDTGSKLQAFRLLRFASTRVQAHVRNLIEQLSLSETKSLVLQLERPLEFTLRLLQVCHVALTGHEGTQNSSVFSYHSSQASGSSFTNSSAIMNYGELQARKTSPFSTWLNQCMIVLETALSTAASLCKYLYGVLNRAQERAGDISETAEEKEEENGDPNSDAAKITLRLKDNLARNESFKLFAEHIIPVAQKLQLQVISKLHALVNLAPMLPLSLIPRWEEGGKTSEATAQIAVTEMLLRSCIRIANCFLEQEEGELCITTRHWSTMHLLYGIFVSLLTSSIPFSHYSHGSLPLIIAEANSILLRTIEKETHCSQKSHIEGPNESVTIQQDSFSPQPPVSLIVTKEAGTREIVRMSGQTLPRRRRSLPSWITSVSLSPTLVSLLQSFSALLALSPTFLMPRMVSEVLPVTTLVIFRCLVSHGNVAMLRTLTYTVLSQASAGKREEENAERLKKFKTNGRIQCVNANDDTNPTGSSIPCELEIEIFKTLIAFWKHLFEAAHETHATIAQSGKVVETDGPFSKKQESIVTRLLEVGVETSIITNIVMSE